MTGFRNQEYPAIDNKLHQINPRIQTQMICNSSYNNIDEKEEFGDFSAKQNSLPDSFTSSIFCARDIKSQGWYRALQIKPRV